MHKYRILIIDDRWDERKNVYETVLKKDFDIFSVEKGRELYEKIETINVDIYLIDIVLSKWLDQNNQPLQVVTVLEKLKKNSPVVLVSNEYGTLLKEKGLTPLLNSIIEKGFNINSFLLWSEFIEASKKINTNSTTTIESTIRLEILKHKKYLSQKEENKYDVAVICALGEELKPFTDKIEDKQVLRTIDNIHIISGIIKTKGYRQIKLVAVQQEEMGTVDAAALTTYVLSNYEINHVFMIGVCGGRDGKVKIGDIIIPHEVVAYQKGKITEIGMQLNVAFAKSIGNIKSAIQNNCEDLIKAIFEEYLTIEIKKGKSIDVQIPEIKYDEMACGETVINKEGELDRISDATAKPKLCAVDMESFAVLRIGEIVKCKTSIIKSVMDLSSNKSDKYKEYAAYISANFLYNLIYEELVTFN